MTSTLTHCRLGRLTSATRPTQAADALAPAPGPVPAPAPAPNLAPSPGDRPMAGQRGGRAKNVGVDGRAPRPWDVAANGQEVRCRVLALTSTTVVRRRMQLSC